MTGRRDGSALLRPAHPLAEPTGTGEVTHVHQYQSSV
jgi:hypothetical protein